MQSLAGLSSLEALALRSGSSSSSGTTGQHWAYALGLGADADADGAGAGSGSGSATNSLSVVEFRSDSGWYLGKAGFSCDHACGIRGGLRCSESGFRAHFPAVQVRR